jgi:Spy/CpxP family protein refolding chaperone
MVRRGGPGGPIRELNLTAEQQEQLNQIWTALAQRESREQEERRQARTDRDNNLMALIPIDSRAKYDEIKKSFDTQMASRDQEWRSAYDLAVERTKKILNADQRARYEQILSRNQSGRGRGPGPGFGGLRGRVSGRGDFPHDSRPEDSYRAPKSATQPVSVQ